MIYLKTLDEIKVMEKANKILAEIFELVSEVIEAGMSAYDLDKFVENEIIKRGATPAFKGYSGYPAATCISVNEEVIHGLPKKEKIFKKGDIVSLDVGTFYDGYYGDAARSYIIDETDDRTLELYNVTKEALDVGISKAVVGNRIGDISSAIQDHVESHGFSVIRDFVGHGIGRNLHEAPQIPNYGSPGRGPLIMEGMVLAIEPMVSMGDWRVRILDGWTVVTIDGSRSAHFEDTIAVLKDGVWILSRL